MKLGVPLIFLPLLPFQRRVTGIERGKVTHSIARSKRIFPAWWIIGSGYHATVAKKYKKIVNSSRV